MLAKPIGRKKLVEDTSILDPEFRFDFHPTPYVNMRFSVHPGKCMYFGEREKALAKLDRWRGYN